MFAHWVGYYLRERGCWHSSLWILHVEGNTTWSRKWSRDKQPERKGWVERKQKEIYWRKNSVMFLPAAFSFCWSAGLSLFKLMLGGWVCCVSRIFNLLCLPHRRWESAHEAQQFPKPYGWLRRRREKSMWGLNLNRRLSSGISIVAQQHAYHESLSNVPEGFFSQDYTIKASQYHSVVLIWKKNCENRTSARAAHILLQKEGEKQQQLALHENLAMKSKSNPNHSGDHLWNKAISEFLDKMDVVNFCYSNNKVCSFNSHVAFQDLFPHQKLY